MDMPSLPFRKLKLFRKYYEYRIVKAVLEDDHSGLVHALKKMNIPEDIFKDYTHICFNGEGAVHYRSGHIRLFMGLLYLAKLQGKTVASVNQTVDLDRDRTLEQLLSKVYNRLDFVSVREPLSYAYLQEIGVKEVQLIPDAVYGLPKMHTEEIESRVAAYDLPEHYIAFTGSSALKRNKTSLEQVRHILSMIQGTVQLPIVFMANAKTDIWLAHQLKDAFDLMIIEPPVKYIDAMAMIAQADILIGGRQHPNIFAYIYETPYVPFEGNTFKNEGVALLQNYPLKPLPWDVSLTDLQSAIDHVYPGKVSFKQIRIGAFNIFDPVA